MPPWYAAAEDWLLARGWPALALIALTIVGITVMLMANGKAIPLAAWLTYLLMP